MTQKSYKIRSKSDFHAWRQADLEGAGLKKWRFGQGLRHPTMHFLRVLRRVEYVKNCCHGPIGRVQRAIFTAYFRLLSIYMGFTIPPNTCGPGLRLNHWGTIVISAEARIGAGARINVCVNRSFPDGAILAGVPAKMIRQKLPAGQQNDGTGDV